MKVGLNSFEDKVILLHPNTPTHKHNDFHKERNTKLKLELFQGDKRVIQVHNKAYRGPASLRERTVDEKMSQGFLHCQWAQNTVVIRDVQISSSKQLSGTQPII